MIRTLTVIALTLLVAGAARADDTGAAEARKRYDSGMAHYNLAEYQEALADFREAYRVRHDPVFLFNMAQCWRQLGDFAQAETFYRSFRRESPNLPNRKDIDRLIAEMHKAAEDRRSGVAPPPTPEPAASPAPVASPAPAAHPTASATPSAEPSGPPAAASTQLVAAPAAAPPGRSPVVKKAWFWVAVVGVVAVVATGVALGVVYGSPPTDPVPGFGKGNGN